MADFKVPGTPVMPKMQKTQPPSIGEAIGPQVPNESVYDEEGNMSRDLLAERDRLNRIGVKSDDLDSFRRGVNIVAEGHQGNIVGDVVLVPPAEANRSVYPKDYKINSSGETIPATDLGASTVVMTPAPTQPQPPVPDMALPAKSEKSTDSKY